MKHYNARVHSECISSVLKQVQWMSGQTLHSMPQNKVTYLLLHLATNILEWIVTRERGNISQLTGGLARRGARGVAIATKTTGVRGTVCRRLNINVLIQLIQYKEALRTMLRAIQNAS